MCSGARQKDASLSGTTNSSVSSQRDRRDAGNYRSSPPTGALDLVGSNFFGVAVIELHRDVVTAKQSSPGVDDPALGAAVNVVEDRSPDVRGGLDPITRAVPVGHILSPPPTTRRFTTVMRRWASCVTVSRR